MNKCAECGKIIFTTYQVKYWDNKQYCKECKESIEKSIESIEKKTETAQRIRNAGDRFFKYKEWDLAIEKYQELLKLDSYLFPIESEIFDDDGSIEAINTQIKLASRAKEREETISCQEQKEKSDLLEQYEKKIKNLTEENKKLQNETNRLAKENYRLTKEIERYIREIERLTNNQQ